MVSHRLAVFVLFLCACAAPQVKLVRPSWSTQASTDVDCSTWVKRASDSQSQRSWRLRAARRAYLCLESKGEDPAHALVISLKLGVEEPHSLELAERYFTEPVDPNRWTLLKPFVGQSVRLDAAILLGRAGLESGDERQRLLLEAVERDPNGVRGRRAMLMLVKDAQSDEQKVRWLRRALEPQRGLWSSFGHAEFAGLSAAAKDLELLCSKLNDAECIRFAKRRHEEIER